MFAGMDFEVTSGTESRRFALKQNRRTSKFLTALLQSPRQKTSPLKCLLIWTQVREQRGGRVVSVGLCFHVGQWHAFFIVTQVSRPGRPTPFPPRAEAAGARFTVSTWDGSRRGADRGLSVRCSFAVRIQQRNGRKCLTTVQGLDNDLDLKRICKAMKKAFNCNGNSELRVCRLAFFLPRLHVGCCVVQLRRTRRWARSSSCKGTSARMCASG